MRTTPISAMEVLTCLATQKLVVQSEAKSGAHCLWSLGSWSYLHPNHGRSSTHLWLQQSDPILNMRVDVMRPAFNLEPKNRVIMLT